MNVLSLVVVVLAASALILYVQLRWAWANYPESRKWLFLRFGSSFLGGAILGLFLFNWDYHGLRLVIAVLLSGLVFGILFTFGFRYNLQRVIPKRDTSDGNQSPE